MQHDFSLHSAPITVRSQVEFWKLGAISFSHISFVSAHLEVRLPAHVPGPPPQLQPGDKEVLLLLLLVLATARARVVGAEAKPGKED